MSADALHNVQFYMVNSDCNSLIIEVKVHQPNAKCTVGEQPLPPILQKLKRDYRSGSRLQAAGMHTKTLYLDFRDLQGLAALQPGCLKSRYPSNSSACQMGQGGLSPKCTLCRPNCKLPAVTLRSHISSQAHLEARLPAVAH